MKMRIKSLSWEDYQKLTEELELINDGTDPDQDMEYFNAWNFGQSDNAGEYITVPQLVMNENLFATSESCSIPSECI